MDDRGGRRRLLRNIPDHRAQQGPLRRADAAVTDDQKAGVPRVVHKGALCAFHGEAALDRDLGIVGEAGHDRREAIVRVRRGPSPLSAVGRAGHGGAVRR
jgi:hypothetical protein